MLPNSLPQYLSNALPKYIDSINQKIALMASFFSLLMLLNNALVVFMRYGLAKGSIALQEMMIYQHAALLLLVAPWALQHNKHVAVDLVFNRLRPSQQAWVTRCGTVLFLWPFCGLVFALSLPYVVSSWTILEQSSEAGGLAFVYLLKSLLLIFPVLLALQGLSELIKTWHNPNKHDK